MSFSPRARATIRAAILSTWAARYAALTPSVRLLTTEGSDAYMLADVLAVVLEGLEAQAATSVDNIFPDSADTESLDHHGVVEGVAREAAVATVLTVAVTGGPISTVTALTGQTLVATTGESYLPVNSSGAALASLTTDGAGAVSFLARCTSPGAVGNLATSSVLTWSSPPSAYPATATVSSTTTVGTEVESDEAYAGRIIDRRQSRPASGNRADWREWCRQYSGVEEAFVYPVLSPTSVVDTLGCVTVVCVGAAQGDSVIDTRLLGLTSGAALPLVKGYVNGDNDAAGITVANGQQLRPVVIANSDITIQVPTVSVQNVELVLVENTANAFAYASPSRLAVVSGTATTVVVAGDYTSLLGKAMLIFTATTTTRGGFVLATSTAAVFGGVNTTFTFPAATFATNPTNDFVGYGVYPAPPNWAAVRTAIFAYFDALGPGEGSSQSLRFPPEDVTARATLYRSALIGDVVNVPGVLNATIPTTPAADVTPAVKVRVTLGQMVVRQ